MRIAQVAPLVESVPPKFYGGTERVVSWLTEELVRQDHDVTLFASGDSVTKATLVAGCDQAFRFSKMDDPTAHSLAMLNDVRRRAADFDIIHFHIDLLQYPLFQNMPSKFVSTLHGRLDSMSRESIRNAYSQIPLVSISNTQRTLMPSDLHWLANIYHGLPDDVCPFQAVSKGYLAFLGRVSREKRPDRAIEIAIKSGIPLKIAAKVDRVDQVYFDTVVKPLLEHPLIDFVGEIDEKQKGAFLGGATALLFPIDWMEPLA